MKVYINASNVGKPLGAATLDEITGLGVDGIRTDIFPDGAEAQLREFRDDPRLQLLGIIMGDEVTGNENVLIDQTRHAALVARNLGMLEMPTPPIFELGNELNIKGYWQKKPELFGRTVATAAKIIWDTLGPEILVVSGGVHNPEKKIQSWLKKAARYFPRSAGAFAVGFHHYAPGMGDPDKPANGFKTVDDQMNSLKALGFPLFDTESGGHTAGKERHSDAEVARWLVRRLEINEKHGLLGSVVFQWNDGSDPTDHLHHFGLRFLDGQPKPSYTALRDWAAARRA